MPCALGRRDESGGQLRLPPGWWVDVAPKNRATSVAPSITASGVPSARARLSAQTNLVLGSDDFDLRLVCSGIPTLAHRCEADARYFATHRQHSTTVYRRTRASIDRSMLAINERTVEYRSKYGGSLAQQQGQRPSEAVAYRGWIPLR